MADQSPRSPGDSPGADGSLEDRVEHLERSVSHLQRSIDALTDQVETLRIEEGRRGSNGRAGSSVKVPSRSDPGNRALSSSEGVARNTGRTTLVDRLRPLFELSTEDWLSRIGIGLLLFGVAFLFRYTVDQGWLVPSVRVGFGAVLGGVLLAVGLRVFKARRRLGQVLLGGSSATFYVTVFAAYQFYGLMPYPYAFAAMVALTVLTFALAVQQNEAVLAVIGAIGGLATPFLLYTDAGSLPGLVAYTSIILAGTSALYLYRGWHSLLYVSAIGGWTVFLVGCIDTSFNAEPTWLEQVSLQSGLLFAWVAFAAVPIARALLRARDPERWAGEQPRSRWLHRLAVTGPAVSLSVSAPFLALAGSRLLWNLPDAKWGLIAIGGSVLYGALYAFLRRVSLSRVAPAHGLAAAILMAYGLSEAFGGISLLLALAAEATVLHLIGRYQDVPSLRLAGHALFTVLGGWLVVRIFEIGAVPPPLFDGAAVSEVLVLGAMVGVSFLFTATLLRYGYRLAAHALFMGWLWKELLPLSNGQAYISVAWGSLAVALLVASTWRQRSRLQYVAIATLLVFVGKLFLIDLATLSPALRILLFIGFGGAFLLISYYLPGLLPGTVEKGVEDERAETEVPGEG